MLIGIAAASLDNAIGRNEKLPWQNSEDMKFFRHMTLGNIIVMGRRTADSVGELKDRETIVLSRSGKHSVEEVLALSRTRDVFICGGAEIYSLFMQYYDAFLLSRIPVEVLDADVFLPKLEHFNKPIVVPFDTFNLELYYKNVETVKWFAIK